MTKYYKKCILDIYLYIKGIYDFKKSNWTLKSIHDNCKSLLNKKRDENDKKTIQFMLENDLTFLLVMKK